MITHQAVLKRVADNCLTTRWQPCHRTTCQTSSTNKHLQEACKKVVQQQSVCENRQLSAQLHDKLPTTVARELPTYRVLTQEQDTPPNAGSQSKEIKGSAKSIFSRSRILWKDRGRYAKRSNIFVLYLGHMKYHMLIAFLRQMGENIGCAKRRALQRIFYIF